MRKEYKKPRMIVIVSMTSYGVMENTLSNGGDSSSPGGPTEAFSKQHDFTSTWGDDENSKEE